MALDTDAILERRRLRRGVSVWRFIAFIALVLAVIATVLTFADEDLLTAQRGQIARITISGIITADRDLVKRIERIRERDAVQAVIVAIDSPGGTAAGGEVLYGALRRLAEEKPVVATVDTLATSAGYMTAIATDQIFVQRSAVTGSIGVIFQYASVDALLGRLGIETEEVKSGDLKAEPNMFGPLTEEARLSVQALVDDTYDWFVSIVEERRPVSDAEIRSYEGRVFTGQMAVSMGLVDGIGGEREAVAWLRAEHEIDEDLPIRDWWPSRGHDDFNFAESVKSFARIFGLGPALTASELRIAFGAQLGLDGLWAVWHPSLSYE